MVYHYVDQEGVLSAPGFPGGDAALKINSLNVSFAGVKSFAERFGERCQERSSQISSTVGAAHPKTFTVTPSAVTPNTRMVQERLRSAQTSTTATADLTKLQKMVATLELSVVFKT